jgi:hypothetical protein
MIVQPVVSPFTDNYPWKKGTKPPNDGGVKVSGTALDDGDLNLNTHSALTKYSEPRPAIHEDIQIRMLHRYRDLKITKLTERRRIIFVNVHIHVHPLRNAALTEIITESVT